MHSMHAFFFWSCTVLLTLRQINIWCTAKLCCHVGKKKQHMGITHLKIRNRKGYWVHFWWKFHLLEHKVLMPFWEHSFVWSSVQLMIMVQPLCLTPVGCSGCPPPPPPPTGHPAAGGGAARGAGHRGSWGTDLHSEGGAGQAAGGAGRHQGPTEGDQ